MLTEGPVPGERVLVVGVDEGAVHVEDRGCAASPPPCPADVRGPHLDETRVQARPWARTRRSPAVHEWVGPCPRRPSSLACPPCGRARGRLRRSPWRRPRPPRAGAQACASMRATPAQVDTDQLAASTLCLLNAAAGALPPASAAAQRAALAGRAAPRRGHGAAPLLLARLARRLGLRPADPPHRVLQRGCAPGSWARTSPGAPGVNRSSPRGIVAAWMASPPHRAEHPQRALPRDRHRRGRGSPAAQRVRPARPPPTPRSFGSRSAGRRSRFARAAPDTRAA